MAGVDRVAGAGVIDVIARIVRHQAVISGVVYALEADGGASFIAFRSMVVDYVKNDFETGVMQLAHHVAKTGEPRSAEIALLGGEKADGVVTPVIAFPFFDEMMIVKKSMDRQQFHRSNAETFDIGHQRLVPEAIECAAQSFRHGWMQHGCSAHMHFIENRSRPFDRWLDGRMGVRAEFTHHAFRHEGRAVDFIQCQIGVFAGVEVIAVDGLVPVQIAMQLAGIRIKEQFAGIEAESFFGRVATMDTISIQLSGLQARDKTVPDFVGVLGQFDICDLHLPGRIEQA